MTWVYLDDRFCEHPKVAAAGDAAAWMFVAGLCYTNRNLTSGFIPAAQVPRLTGSKNPTRDAKRLVEVGLWATAEGGYSIHDYSDHNPSAEKRKVAAKKAARARWDRTADAPPPDDETACDSDAIALRTHDPAHCEPDANALRSQCLPHSPTPSDSKSSSSLTLVPPPPGDEEALAIAANRALERRTREVGQVGDPVAWTAGYREKNRTRLEGLTGTPLELADRLEPPPPAPPPPLCGLCVNGNVETDDGGVVRCECRQAVAR